jgi:hypothetical protein
MKRSLREPTEVSYSGRKADGTHVQKRSLGPLAKEEWSRHIRFLDGTSIQLVDVLHIKMTSRVENPRFTAAMKRSLNEQSGTCNLNNRGTVISTGVIFDQFVEQIESVIGKGEYKLTISKAPSLGCEGLAYESFWRQQDGSYKQSEKEYQFHWTSLSPRRSCSMLVLIIRKLLSLKRNVNLLRTYVPLAPSNTNFLAAHGDGTAQETTPLACKSVFALLQI